MATEEGDLAQLIADEHASAEGQPGVGGGGGWAQYGKYVLIGLGAIAVGVIGYLVYKGKSTPSTTDTGSTAGSSTGSGSDTGGGTGSTADTGNTGSTDSGVQAQLQAQQQADQQAFQGLQSQIQGLQQNMEGQNTAFAQALQTQAQGFNTALGQQQAQQQALQQSLTAQLNQQNALLSALESQQVQQAQSAPSSPAYDSNQTTKQTVAAPVEPASPIQTSGGEILTPTYGSVPITPKLAGVIAGIGSGNRSASPQPATITTKTGQVLRNDPYNQAYAAAIARGRLPSVAKQDAKKATAGR